MELTTAIRLKAAADSTLWTAIGGRFWYAQGPPTTTMPCITYHIIGHIPTHAFSEGSSFENAVVQFSIFDKNRDITNITTIQGYLDDVFNRASLTYGTKTQIGCIRVRTGQPERLEDCWQWTTDYEIEYTS